MHKLAICLSLVVAVLGCDVKAINDYQEGYKVGRTAVREAKQNAGIIAQIAGEFSYLVGSEGPPGKSADFNAGYQAGKRDELKEFYK